MKAKVGGALLNRCSDVPLKMRLMVRAYEMPLGVAFEPAGRVTFPLISFSATNKYARGVIIPLF